jgi:hypothetical protein
MNFDIVLFSSKGILMKIGQIIQFKTLREVVRYFALMMLTMKIIWE